MKRLTVFLLTLLFAVPFPGAAQENKSAPLLSFEVMEEGKWISETNATFVLVAIHRLNEQTETRWKAKVSKVVVGPCKDCWAEIEKLRDGEYKVTISPEQFRGTESQTASTILHEYGHLVHYQAVDDKVLKDYFKKLSYEEKAFFKDGDFVHDDGGAPWKNYKELFASAYSLACLVNEGFVKKEDVNPTGEAACFFEWIQSFPLLRIRIDPYPEWERRPFVFPFFFLFKSPPKQEQEKAPRFFFPFPMARSTPRPRQIFYTVTCTNDSQRTSQKVHNIGVISCHGNPNNHLFLKSRYSLLKKRFMNLLSKRISIVPRNCKK